MDHHTTYLSDAGAVRASAPPTRVPAAGADEPPAAGAEEPPAPAAGPPSPIPAAGDAPGADALAPPPAPIERPAPAVAPEGAVEAARSPGDPLASLRAREDRRADPGSWRGAVERRLERHAADGSPFALLAVEVDGIERLLAADEGEVGEGLDRLERAFGAELRPADQLLREGPGRYWVTAPDTGPAVARLLAERIAEAAGSAAVHRGVPLTVSVGVASCPDDGIDPDALADRADRALFAARAAGTTVA
jgi:GGDEF domain-containing protein